MLDPRHLVTLRTVARLGSFSRAAEELGYTQPAMSLHVHALERQVGTPLLIRDGRKRLLTPAGETLLRHAHHILAALTVAEEELAAIANMQAGRVRIAAFPSAGATLVPWAIVQFRRHHPDVEVSLVALEPPRSIELVQQGDFDIAVAHTSFATDEALGAGLVAEPLMVDRHSVILPASHRQAEKSVVELADLASEAWVAGCPRCRYTLLNACEEVGFEPRIGFETDDNAAAQALVANGLGIALVSELILKAVKMDGIVNRPVRPARTRQIQAVMLVPDRRSAATEAMFGCLRDAAAAT